MDEAFPHQANLVRQTRSPAPQHDALKRPFIPPLFPCLPTCNAALLPCRQVLQEDKARGRWDVSAAEGGPRPLKLTVRRDQLLEDAYAALGGMGEAMKGRLYVSKGRGHYGVCAGHCKGLLQRSEAQMAYAGVAEILHPC
jgi:hypothetical protein